MVKLHLVLLAFVIAGCTQTTSTSTDSDDTTTPPPPPPVESVGPAQGTSNLPASFMVTYDSGTATVTVADISNSTTLARYPAWDNGDILGYFFGTGDGAVYAVTPSGDGQALSVAYQSAGYAGIAYDRLASSDLPLSGTADYSGNYSGLLVDGITSARDVILGDMSLSADFAAGTISGLINNRVSYLGGGVSFSDVNLASAAISNGAFNGTASGGEGDGFLTTVTSNGQYEGLIVGSDGTEIVGGLTLDHILLALPHTEYGIFISD